MSSPSSPLAIATSLLCALPAGAALPWSSLPSLPDTHGFASMYAGVSGGALVAAGGANFSERPLAEGGTKIWHDRIFVLPHPTGTWQEVGKLPKPAAYGISVSWRDAVVCVGGSDAKTHFADAWLMRWRNASLQIEPLPPLPTPNANACGALLGDTLYVIGGQSRPDATTGLNQMWSLDLAAPQSGWREHAWPEGAPARIQGVAGAQGGEAFLFSGFEIHATADGKVGRTFLRDAYAYRPGRGWRRLADLPYATPAAPSPALSLGTNRLLVLSGVSEPTNSSGGPGKPFSGFSKKIIAYHLDTDTWQPVPTEPAAPATPPAVVTAPTVAWRDRFLVVNGEVAPGIRTSTVLLLGQPFSASP